MFKRFIVNEHGNALVLVSIALLGLLAATGLVIDGGILYMTKSHLQKTANAAALSGAQQLTESRESIEEVVNRILVEHKENDSLQQINIENGKRISVQLEKPVQLAFSQLFGRDEVSVNVFANAEIGNMGRAMGASPIGIDDSIQLEYYKNYSLKVDSSGVSFGNFGILALGGPGANTYEDNLRHGYRSEIKVGDVLETQTGNIAGKTRKVIKEKIQQCPYNLGDAIDRNCSRIILIPVYKPHNYISGQIKEVKVTGFAYFFIVEPMTNHDTSITGMFIKKTGTGFIEPGASDRGAYSIRLTK